MGGGGCDRVHSEDRRIIRARSPRGSHPQRRANLLWPDCGGVAPTHRSHSRAGCRPRYTLPSTCTYQARAGGRRVNQKRAERQRDRPPPEYQPGDDEIACTQPARQTECSPPQPSRRPFAALRPASALAEYRETSNTTAATGDFGLRHLWRYQPRVERIALKISRNAHAECPTRRVDDFDVGFLARNERDIGVLV